MNEPLARGTAPAQHEAFVEHARLFQMCYGDGEDPRMFFSPGRVNLFGGHLDYSGGPVMPTAIDRGTFIALRRRADRAVRIASTLDRDGLRFELDETPMTRLGRWVDYPLGVVADLLVRARGQGTAAELSGFEVLFGGNLPIGAGLSSSASICVGTALALERIWNLDLGRSGRVQSALRAERGFVGVQCGIMDPFAVGYAKPGHLLWLDCKDESWEHLPIDFESVSILIANTGVRRELAASEFNRRVEQCAEAFALLGPHAPGATCLRDISADVLDEHASELPEVVAMRARHVVDEVQRTFRAREALLEGDTAELGRLMTATHHSLRDLYEVSCMELDVLVDAANEHGAAYGSRLTGAGFGGCTVILVPRDAREDVAQHVARRFEAACGRTPEIDAFAGDEGPRELRV